MKEDEWKHGTIASDHPKHHDVDWMFGFQQLEYESVFRLALKDSEVFVLEFLMWMSNSTVCCFQISGGVNCVMVLLSLLIVSNWL